jgi:hypothetical protein
MAVHDRYAVYAVYAVYALADSRVRMRIRTCIHTMRCMRSVRGGYTCI